MTHIYDSRDVGESLLPSSYVINLLIAVVMSLVLPTSANAQDRCSRAVLDPSPQWAFSAAWNSNALVMIDIADLSLVEFDMSKMQPRAKTLGQSRVLWDVAAQKSAFNGQDEIFTPTKIRSDAAGKNYYVVSDSIGGDAVVWALTEDFRFAGATGLNSLPRTKNGVSEAVGGSIQAIYDFAPISSQSFLGFGDIRTSDGTWRTGFLKVDAGLASSFSEVETFDSRSPYKAYYLTGQNMICTGNGAAHALVVYDSPRLISVKADGETTTVNLSDAFGKNTKAPDWSLFSFESLFAGAASVAGPEGVYCRENDVYLLVREIGEVKKYTWKLARVDLGTGRISAAWILPTTAQHVFLALGQNQLAVVSKGSPQWATNQVDQPVQPVEYVDLIPLSLLAADKRSSLQEAQPVCR